jgi:predicted enzyme related to lactoylglutathione lyase
MMSTNTVSAVLFAKDLRSVADFYREVLGASVSHADSEHQILSCSGFRLVVHQIPSGLAQAVVVTAPPQRRERSALRLNFPVDDIENSRQSALRLGGQIDASPPPWSAGDESFFLGYDPEGNVIGVTLRG